MTRELHIDSNELAHFDDYEGAFNEMHLPGPSCAIRVYIPEDYYHDEEWEMVLYHDLEALGVKPGESVWVEIDY
jgi:hypothetical protein